MNTVIGSEVQTVAELERLRREIEELDEQILAAIQRRTVLARRIGAISAAANPARPVGGEAGRIQQRHELSVISRFLELGPEGRTLGMVLLRLGRGRAHPVQRPNRVRYAPGCDQYTAAPDTPNSR